jgi:hypothetical protein
MLPLRDSISVKAEVFRVENGAKSGSQHWSQDEGMLKPTSEERS